jgi:hypothetical protein
LNLKAALQLVKKASRLAQKNGNVSA